MASKERFPSKNIWVWSGFLYDKDLADKEILHYIDVLVDGTYVAKNGRAQPIKE